MITAPMLSMFVIPAAYLLIHRSRRSRTPRDERLPIVGVAPAKAVA